AVHDDGVHAGLLEEHDILGKGGRERRIAHGMAAIFDDDGLPVVALHMRQGLGEDTRLHERRWRRLAGARYLLLLRHLPRSSPGGGSGPLFPPRRSGKHLSRPDGWLNGICAQLSATTAQLLASPGVPRLRPWASTGH